MTSEDGDCCRVAGLGHSDYAVVRFTSWFGLGARIADLRQSNDY